MCNKLNAPLILFFLAISLLFACDKEDINKEFGNYAVAVSYNSKQYVELHFVINGEECGKFVPVPNVNPSYVKDCSELKNTDNLTNVFVIKQVLPGEHKLEIKTAEGAVLETLTFQMVDKECVFQDLNIKFN